MGLMNNIHPSFRLGKQNCGSKLRTLKLSGCVNVTDVSVVRLAMALSTIELPKADLPYIGPRDGGGSITKNLPILEDKIAAEESLVEEQTETECLCEEFQRKCHLKIPGACDDKPESTRLYCSRKSANAKATKIQRKIKKAKTGNDRSSADDPHTCVKQNSRQKQLKTAFVSSPKAVVGNAAGKFLADSDKVSCKGKTSTDHQHTGESIGSGYGACQATLDISPCDINNKREGTVKIHSLASRNTGYDPSLASACDMAIDTTTMLTCRGHPDGEQDVPEAESENICQTTGQGCPNAHRCVINRGYVAEKPREEKTDEKYENDREGCHRHCGAGHHALTAADHCEAIENCVPVRKKNPVRNTPVEDCPPDSHVDEANPDPEDCTVIQDAFTGTSRGSWRKQRPLEHLDLSGCHLVTDVGLRFVLQFRISVVVEIMWASWLQPCYR